MGLFDKIFPKQNQVQSAIQGYFKTLTAYSPSFTSYDGGIYEMELTRAAIDRYATFCSKLKPEIQGSAYKNLEKILQYKPNPWMNTSQFLYRVATILKVNTTAFIIPLYAEDMETIIGFYPLLPTNTELIQVAGEPWLRYRFTNGQTAAIEYNRVGVLTRYQYKNDFFGDGNSALNATMNLLDIQKQGIVEGIKQSATIRFIARLANIITPDDLKKEKERFSLENLSNENTTGVLMFDNKYAEVKQIESKAIFLDAEQMKIIQNNVFNYFGTNEDILQNKYDENKWNAYYEGEIEPFAIQLSLVLSNMLFTQKEIAFNNAVIFTANRLQYASNTTKLQVSSQMFDRGILTTNQVMDIWNMAHVEDGDKRYIRKEYAEISKLNDNTDKEGVNIHAINEGQGVQESTDTTTTDTAEEN
ncbi:MAG: phage portal protein [Herbinix sp.]|nr:phage portal protein [Herbinix sp.]